MEHDCKAGKGSHGTKTYCWGILLNDLGDVLWFRTRRAAQICARERYNHGIVCYVKRCSDINWNS